MTPSLAPVVLTEGALPSCWQCRHMGITYEAHQPYLCRAMGIKTRALPSIEVFRADGRPCQGFTPKKVAP